MVWRKEDPQGSESLKVRWEIVPYTRGKVLDIGCGPHKPFAHFTGVDNNVDAELFGIYCKPDILIKDATDLRIFGSQSWDAVFSSHLLEHIEDTEKALREWWRLVKQGGHMVLYLPHKSFYPNIGEEGSNHDHKHDFLPDDIIEVMKKIVGWDLVANQERNEGTEYSFLQVYRKVGSGYRHSWGAPKPTKTAGVVRYGGFGDMIQASSVVKGLKDQGYHVTLYTSTQGHDVIINDPNIDRIYLQDKDQVPNHELGSFWKWEKAKYDKFVNLSESVEGELLALHGRMSHGWNPLLRHQRLNINYQEFQHQIAQIPHKPQMKFYSTEEERKWARKQREKMGEFCILWQLTGSSVHKHWPYLDRVLGALMLSHPGIHVVLTGEPLAKILEAGWENEPRIHKRSGEWTIRETLVFLEVCDCVIGPETGVLNAAALLPVPKIVFLSHSSHENLTRDWVNTYPLYGENVKCPGRGDNEAPACHQMHYGWDHCKKDEEQGAAACQVAITADMVESALNVILTRHFERAAA